MISAVKRTASKHISRVKPACAKVVERAHQVACGLTASSCPLPAMYYRLQAAICTFLPRRTDRSFPG
jgi:hypothetical protein